MLGRPTRFLAIPFGERYISGRYGSDADDSRPYAARIRQLTLDYAAQRRSAAGRSAEGWR